MLNKKQVTNIPIGRSAPGAFIIVEQHGKAPNKVAVRVAIPSENGLDYTYVRTIESQVSKRAKDALVNIEDVFATHNASTNGQKYFLPEGEDRQALREAIVAAATPILSGSQAQQQRRSDIADTLLQRNGSRSYVSNNSRAAPAQSVDADPYSHITNQLESALHRLPETRNAQLEKACFASSFYRKASPNNGHTRMQQAMRNALRVVAGKWDEESGPHNPDVVFVEVLGELQRHPANARPAGFQPRFSGAVRR